MIPLGLSWSQRGQQPPLLRDGSVLLATVAHQCSSTSAGLLVECAIRGQSSPGQSVRKTEQDVEQTYRF